MNMRTFLTLGGATAFAVVLAATSAFNWRTDSVVSERGQTFLPKLASEAGSISAIKVEDGDEKFTIKREGDRFVDASGFPVKPEVVRDLVTSVSVLKIEETKTGDASRHKDLDLASPGAEDGAGKRIVFQDAGGNAISGIIAGKSDYSVGGVGGGQYVRAADSDQTYLVRGTVKLPFSRTGWFDTKLFEVKAENVLKASLDNKESGVVSLTKDGDKLLLANLPEGKLADEDKINRITRLFGSLTFSDVRAKAPGGSAKSGPTVSVETSDGLKVMLVALDADDKQRWVRLEASKTREDARERAVELTSKVEGFEFKLSSYDSELFDWSMTDLIKDPQS